jgi:hypothetical protein
MWFKKKVYRGASKTPSARLKEEQARIDIKLAKMWGEYLERHPSYAQEIAKAKFAGGFEEQPTEYGGEAPPDLLDVLRQAREAKELIKEEVGGGQESTLNIILKTVGEIVAPMVQKKLMEQPVLGERPPTKRLEEAKAEKSTLEQQQQSVIDFIKRLLDMPAEETAAEIYKHRDEADDLRSYIYKFVIENSFDDLMELLPGVSSTPGYEFLGDLVAKVDRKKLALIYDELIALKLAEEKAEQEQIGDK